MTAASTPKTASSSTVRASTRPTPTRTYWLAGGRARGLRLGTLSAEAEPGGAPSFAYTVESRERSVYFAALVNGERENFFGRVVTSQPVEQSMILTHLDAAAEAGAELEVALQGVTDMPHQVKVSVNGAEAGRVSLEGRGWKSERLLLAAGVLREGENVIAFAGEAGPSDISLVDYLRLTYQRTYTADQGELLLSVGTAGPQTISGFGGGHVRVIDITRPGAPVELAGKIESQDGNYSVTVNVAGPRTLLAFTPDRARQPDWLALNTASVWRQHSHGADLIVVTRRELKEALGPLLALRQSQGLSVAVVEVEDLYDEYSFGQKRPQAIKDFLAEAQGKWRRSPRYLLLAGDASFDPKGYLGRGDRDLVPTGLIDTATMEAASDDWLADFDGDGLPELAVGRLPVLTAEEAARVVAKIASYESSEGGAGLLLVADRNDGFDFEGANAALGSLLPAGAEVREIRRGQTDDATARAQLIESLNSGPRLVNFTGHGSVDFWRGNLLTAGDAAGLGNGERPSVFVMMDMSQRVLSRRGRRLAGRSAAQGRRRGGGRLGLDGDDRAGRSGGHESGALSADLRRGRAEARGGDGEGEGGDRRSRHPADVGAARRSDDGAQVRGACAARTERRARYPRGSTQCASLAE